jgi:tRNA nucleotidyltransferase/poly(A) polymerase
MLCARLNPQDARQEPDSPRETAVEIASRLQRAGFAAFWVGGCVRDFLLGREPQDFDIATDAKPEQVEKLFKRIRRRTQIRRDGRCRRQASIPGRHVPRRGGLSGWPAPGESCLCQRRGRRAAPRFHRERTFLRSAHGKNPRLGRRRKGFARKIIRTIGSPEERFGEDHLRLLRAVRLPRNWILKSSRNFCRHQIARAENQAHQRRTDSGRALKLFSPPPHAARGLVLLRDSGLLEQILPELAATISCEQSPDYHPEGSVFNHIRLMLEKLPPDADESLPWAVCCTTSPSR